MPSQAIQLLDQQNTRLMIRSTLYLAVLVGPVVGSTAHGGGANGGAGTDAGAGKDGSVHFDYERDVDVLDKTEVDGYCEKAGQPGFELRHRSF